MALSSNLLKNAQRTLIVLESSIIKNYWKSIPKMYKSTGFFFVIIAVFGIVLPLLPSTPFLLIAAYFFSKSSEKWHKWLLDNKIFGQLIKNWERNKSIDLKSKILAISMMLIFGSYSVIFLLKSLFLKVICCVLLGYAAWFILKTKTS